MLKPLALAATLALSTPALAQGALAIECPLSHAIFGQSTSATRIIFFQPDRDWAANQIAGFRLEIAGTSYDGTVHMPNGFSQPKGRLTKDCAPDDTDTDACSFWDGIVYALVDGRIAELPHFVEDVPADEMAPQQLLLPGFAANVWYSMLREAAFPGDDMVTDTFDLVACAK
jgi:hypothetical protein